MFYLDLNISILFQSQVSHSYATLECKLDAVLKLRKQLKAEGTAVSVNDFVIKAVAATLTQCPKVNCVWHGDQVCIKVSIYYLYCEIN